MTERQILFSAPLVRAILDGRKTQTRRVCRLGDDEGPVSWPCPPPEVCEHCGATTGRRCEEPAPHELHVHSANGFNWRNIPCPFGGPGDRLWVRETFALDESLDELRPLDVDPKSSIWWRANSKHRKRAEDCTPGRWRPSIHMPRWASRIALEVTAVHVESLQSITPGDALAEGCSLNPDVLARDEFRELWDRINAKRGYSWASNPPVWVVSFRKALPHLEACASATLFERPR